MSQQTNTTEHLPSSEKKRDLIANNDQFLNSLLHNLRLKNIVVGVKASGFLTTIVKNIQKTFQSTVPTLCDFS